MVILRRKIEIYLFILSQSEKDGKFSRTFSNYILRKANYIGIYGIEISFVHSNFSTPF